MSPVRPRAQPESTQLSLDSRFEAPPPIDADDAAPADLPTIPEPASPVTPAPRAAGDEDAPPRPAPPVRPEVRVLAVAELVRAARVALESRFADVRVEGEISGLRRSGPGHLYFCLKDTEAQIDCVMFSREANRLKFRVDDGLKVRCRGRLTIYEGRGKFQLAVVAIEPAGAGALALAFEQLKQKLAAEGLFDPARKRVLPFLPRRIGVVTSAQGAVIRDIVRVAHRRFPVPILLAPAPVQGDGAAGALITALRKLASVPDVDVVIVARGGGSLEDLWAFNDEALARAIAACPKPVISAVGHETDFTIADFVADVRAPTPSAAAELAVPVAVDLLAEMAVLRRRLGRGLERELSSCRLRLERARARLGDPRRLLDERRQAVDDLLARAARLVQARVARGRTAVRAAETRLFRAHPQRRIADQRQALLALERRLASAGGRAVVGRRGAMEGLWGRLGALSPLRVLERGYSLARGEDGRLLTSADTVAEGQAVTVVLRDGDLRTRVEAVAPRRRDK